MSDPLKIFIALIPFMVCSLIALWIVVRQREEQNDLDAIIAHSTVSIREQTATKIEGDTQTTVNSKLDARRFEMEMFEFPYTMDEVLGACMGAGILAAFLSIVLFKAGPLLMLYLGGVAAYTLMHMVDSWIEKRRFELTIEYLEKMRDVSSLLSAGKEFSDALREVCEGNISSILKRELETVRKDIFTGTSKSTAILSMYNRLKIEDIRTYAQTLKTWERTGGSLIRIMAINDRYSKQRLEIQGEQNVFANSQKSSQKIIVGIPAAMVFGMGILNPSWFGDFYNSITGQLIAIGAVSVLVVGLTRSGKLAKGTGVN